MPAVATMDRPGSAETRVAGSTPALAQASTRGLGPLGLGRRRLPVDVGHAEPATDDELGQTERSEERAEHLGRLLERGGLEDLAPDVRVDPDQLDARHELERGDRLGGGARRDGEAELRVLLPGAHELVRVRLDTRCDPDEHPGPGGGVGGDDSSRPSEAGDLVEGIDDDAADARARAPSPARRSTCCCRAGRGGPPGRRPTGRRGARHRRRRRGACPPRGPAGPWPGTGRPWWRRRHRPPRRRPRHGTRGAGGPRRRRRAACRTPPPARAGRCRRRGGDPSRRPTRYAGGVGAPGARSPRRGRSPWRCRIRQLFGCAVPLATVRPVPAVGVFAGVLGDRRRGRRTSLRELSTALLMVPRGRWSGDGLSWRRHRDVVGPSVNGWRVPSSPALATPAPVAQRIEHRPPEPVAQVRVLPGAPSVLAGQKPYFTAGDERRCQRRSSRTPPFDRPPSPNASLGGSPRSRSHLPPRAS